MCTPTWIPFLLFFSSGFFLFSFSFSLLFSFSFSFLLPLLLLPFLFFFFSSSFPLFLSLSSSFSSFSFFLSSPGFSLYFYFPGLFPREASHRLLFFFIKFRSSRLVVALPGRVAHWSNFTASIAMSGRDIGRVLAARNHHFSPRATHRVCWSRYSLSTFSSLHALFLDRSIWSTWKP
ncbi:hypothetical protein ACOSQ3_028795 [Xanthoceras sorbifolium]